MAEELAFARKASGMVRGLSMIDAFAVGMMNQGITPSIWTMITWGLGTYLTGNLLWASIISLVLVGFGFPLVWGILSGSMPRSGGEYIYNSRIIHPIVGIAESFGNAFVMIFWVYVPWRRGSPTPASSSSPSTRAGRGSTTMLQVPSSAG